MVILVLTNVVAALDRGEAELGKLSKAVKLVERDVRDSGFFDNTLDGEEEGFGRLGDDGGARVRAREISNGTVFATPDENGGEHDVEGLLLRSGLGEVGGGVLKGTWKRIISRGVTRPTAEQAGSLSI